jgi:hypothetical protein
MAFYFEILRNAMRFILLFASLLASPFALASAASEPATSVSVLNLSNDSVDLWMNGEYRELRASSGLQYPCLQGEKVEVQVGMKLDYLVCGEIKEIEQ